MTDLTHILRIARAGNSARALQLFAEQGLDTISSDPKALTLKGRLLKDQAKRSSGAERRELFDSASRAYQAAFELDASSYALINAAALAFLSRRQDASRRLAGQALAMIERDQREGETPYWREATRSEALLLLDRRAEAESALANAIAVLPHAYEDRAATIGQFEMIEAERSASAEWLDFYRVPASLYFSGLINLDEEEAGLKRMIEEAVAALKPGFAFGALAAGADIILAEALVELGAMLHVHLPSEPNAFRAASVQPFGDKWGARFDRLIDLAETVDALDQGLNETPRSFGDAIDLASLDAMGATIRQARNLRSRVSAVTIVGAGEPSRRSLDLWREAGHSATAIEAVRVAGNAQLPGAKASSSGNLKAVLSLPSADADTRIMAKRMGLLDAEQAGCVFFVGEPRACLDLLSQRPDSWVKGGGGFVLDAQSIFVNSGLVLDRARQLCDAAGPAICLADRVSARVADVMEPAIWVEEFGEMRTLQGPISLWSISS